jgi:molecular chaperone GrpE
MTGNQRAEAAAAYATAAAQQPSGDGNDGAEVNPAGEPEETSEPVQPGVRDQTGAGVRDQKTQPVRTEPGQAEPRQAEPARAEPADGSPPHELERDLDELAARAEKADEYLVLAQRTRADFENYRKRAAREAALAQERGIARLAKELLPAIDNLDRAVQAAELADANPTAAGNGTDSQLVSGIKLVHADVLAALARAGIEPFSPVGEPFDPRWHEAVAQLPVEGSEPGMVIEVYQQGYRLGDAVLRPARVLVAA